MERETRIREAAQALADAIEDGKTGGLTVQWPSRAEDLPAIAISETGKTATPWVEILLPAETWATAADAADVVHDPDLTSEPATLEKSKRPSRDA